MLYVWLDWCVVCTGLYVPDDVPWPIICSCPIYHYMLMSHIPLHANVPLYSLSLLADQVYTRL